MSRHTESHKERQASKAKARRYRNKIMRWLNSGRPGAPPQPSVWFPELQGILNQAGLLRTVSEEAPANFYIPKPELSDEENRYEAQLARNRARYALARNPANRVAPTEQPEQADAPSKQADEYVEYEMRRVRIHARNLQRARRGEEPLPMPPPRPRVDSDEFWEAAGLRRPTIARLRIAAFEAAISGKLPESSWTADFRQKLAAYIKQSA